MKSVDSYVEGFTNLSDAGVGVILTRTREPSRVIDLIIDNVINKGLSIDTDMESSVYFWDTHTGLTRVTERETISLLDDAENFHFENVENLEPPYMLSSYLDFVYDDQTDMEFDHSIHVVLYPHFFLGSYADTVNDPAAVQALKNLALRKLPKTNTRLVLVTPVGFELPDELKDDIPILDMDTPSREEYADIYHETISSVLGEDEELFDEDQVYQLCSMCAGMTGNEFEVAISRAFASKKDDDYEKFSQFILDIKTEIIKRSEVLNIVESIPINQVGGVELFKEWIEQRKSCFTREYYEFGGDKLKGVMLCGCPGTGKSLLAKCIAHTLNKPCIHIDLARVFDKYVGNSEARIDAALKMLESISPCVAYIDEIDKLFSGHSSSDVEKRVMGKFLTWLQENDSDVFMIFTANNVDGLPPELIRKGRIDEIFNIGMPTAQERYDVMKIHLEKRKKDISTISDIATAVYGSEGYMQAEIENAVKESVIHSFITGKKITGEMIKGIMLMTQPLSVSHAEQIARIDNWAKSNARMASKACDGTVVTVCGTISEDSKPIKKRRKIKTSNNRLKKTEVKNV